MNSTVKFRKSTIDGEQFREDLKRVFEGKLIEAGFDPENVGIEAVEVPRVGSAQVVLEVYPHDG